MKPSNLIRRPVPHAREVFAVLLATASFALLVLSFRVFHSVAPGEFVVRRGTLDSEVALVGTLAPDRSETYAAEVPGVELKILWLAEEGTAVSAGDPLIRFDPAPFQRELESASERVRELSQEAEQSRLALSATELSQQSDLHEAETSASAAGRELVAFVNTAAPLSVQESAHALEQRQRDAEEAQAKLDGLEPFVKDGFISQEEYRAAKARRDQALADLRLSQAQHDALVHQTQPDLLTQKTDEVRTRELQLSLQKRKLSTQVSQAQAAYELEVLKRNEAARQKADAEQKIARCAVTARTAGLVVYGEIFEKGGERRKVRVGDAVWGGTAVITLPDMSHLLVEGRVPESEIHRLSPGEPVRVRLDAFPDRELSGRVRHVGSLGSSERSESRSFPLAVAIDQSDPRFRPGMIARATVQCGRVDNALYVPIDAVRSDPRGTACRVVSPLGRISNRLIQTGINTSQYVEVVRGLSEGDVVRIGEN